MLNYWKQKPWIDIGLNSIKLNGTSKLPKCLLIYIFKTKKNTLPMYLLNKDKYEVGTYEIINILYLIKFKINIFYYLLN